MISCYIFEKKKELGCIRWSRFEQNSLEEMRLCSETEFPEQIVCRLLEDNYLQKNSSKTILSALAHRWHISLNLMGRITKFMEDDDGSVRRVAIDALGRESPWQHHYLL